jgi:hypothetical protein
VTSGKMSRCKTSSSPISTRMNSIWPSASLVFPTYSYTYFSSEVS